jgi:hypothetical protein
MPDGSLDWDRICVFNSESKGVNVNISIVSHSLYRLLLSMYYPPLTRITGV